MIDAVVSSEPYWHHIAPIWQALTERGLAGTLHHRNQPGTPTGNHPVLIAAARDLNRIPANTPIIYTAHGVGQCYAGIPNSLINTTSEQLDRIALAVGPNQQWTANMRALGVPAVTVGAPKLDQPLARPVPGDRLKVGLVWHWDQTTYPETRSAFLEYAPAFAELTEAYDVYGTTHPRAGLQRSHRRGKVRTRADWYDDAGVSVVADVQDLLSQVDLVVGDNTSVLFEAAAQGWPVVLVDSKRYRIEVSHGLRFWEWADIGPRTKYPDMLAWCVQESWDQRAYYAGIAGEMREVVFPHWGSATGRAVAAIETWLRQQ